MNTVEQDLLQELAKIGNVNTERLVVVVNEVSDVDFEASHGEVIFARIDITVPESVVKALGVSYVQ